MAVRVLDPRLAESEDVMSYAIAVVLLVAWFAGMTASSASHGAGA
jgi:hypothetical protein